MEEEIKLLPKQARELTATQLQSCEGKQEKSDWAILFSNYNNLTTYTYIESAQ